MEATIGTGHGIAASAPRRAAAGERAVAALGRAVVAVRSSPLVATAVALGAFTAVVVARQAAESQFLAVNSGCGWDGALYCNAAFGAVVTTPYSRRPLAPFLVRHDPWGGLLQRFLTVDLAAVGLSVVLVALLVRRLCGVHADPYRRRAGMVLGACLVLLTPFTLRFALSYPANTDEVSLALGLLVVLLVLRERLWLAVPATFLCTLAREQWGAVVLVLAVLDLLFMRRRPLVHVTLAAAAIGGLVLDFSLPNQGGEPPMGSVIHRFLTAHFTSLAGLEQSWWLVLTGFGLVPLLAVLGRNRSARRRDTFVVGVVCLAEAALAVSGGDDTARIVLPGAVLLSALAVSTVVRAGSPRRDAVFVALLAGSIAVWRPWVIAPVPGEAWLNWFTPYYDAEYGHPAWFPQRLLLDSSLALGGLALAALPLLLRRWQPVAAPVEPERRVARERRAPPELRRLPARAGGGGAAALSPGDAWLVGTGSAVELAATLKRRRRPAPRAGPSRAGTARSGERRGGLDLEARGRPGRALRG